VVNEERAPACISALIALVALMPFSLSQALAQDAALQQNKVRAGQDDSRRDLIPDRWWERAGAICSILLKSLPPDAQGRAAVPPSFDPKNEAQASAYFDELKAKGCDALLLDNPGEIAGRVYPHLATKDHYKVAPDIGSLDNFRRLVRLSHTKSLPVMIDYNLGYCSLEAPHWLKACDDVRAGRASKESKWFLWSDSPDAPPPVVHKDTFFLVRPAHLPGNKPGTSYDSKTNEVWEYSERAGRYYWSKWSGNVDGKIVRLPQYNWNSQEFQEEAERINRFWMDTGIDGMQQDAVSWYVGYTWEKGRQRITDVITSYGNTYLQPEGAGGFREDPVAWITEGGWNSVQDYGLGIWWEKGSDVIGSAIESGDPRPIERALRDYHDRVVAVGGVLWKFVSARPQTLEPAKHRLIVATVISLGNMIPMEGSSLLEDPEVRWLFQTKRSRPALHQLGTRRQLPTNADHKYYAFLRTSADASERVLVVLNFQSAAQTVKVDLSGVATAGLVDLKDGTVCPRHNPFGVEVPAHGYRLYEVKAPIKLP